MTAKPWFRPKTFGYGSGLPICWQGWALLAGFFILFVGGHLGLLWLLPPGRLRRVLSIALSVVLVAGLIWIARAKTEGEWRWRWGNDD